ncbi:MAG: 50S ribosomal protein L35 [bacterium]|nr:50S ribosomal protein L35 [bacterium]
MKIKSRSSAKKRVRLTGTGKIKVMKVGRRHLLQQKSKKQKRLGKAGKIVELSPTFKYQVIKALPYLSS